MMIPHTAHGREIVRAVDEHARQGTLRVSSMQDIVNSLSFSPRHHELRFLRCYTAWRLEHLLPGITQP